MITTKYSTNKPLQILGIIRDANNPKKETGLVWVETEFGEMRQLLIHDLRPEEEVGKRLNELRNNES